LVASVGSVPIGSRQATRTCACLYPLPCLRHYVTPSHILYLHGPGYTVQHGDERQQCSPGQLVLISRGRQHVHLSRRWPHVQCLAHAPAVVLGQLVLVRRRRQPVCFRRGHERADEPPAACLRFAFLGTRCMCARVHLNERERQRERERERELAVSEDTFGSQ
jgi:hypothetical protein